MPRNILIMGAAGRDFHIFNLCFRQDTSSRVVAFTATQIPNISDRRYPAELSGPLYPEGIPIFPENELDRLIRQERIDQVVFGYSDISHLELMHQASRVLALGADFVFLSPERTQIRSKKPVVSICAVRTGCGKSPTTRHLCKLIQGAGRNPVVVRHPMPYGDLRRQRVQKFTTTSDLTAQQCTFEEREEYEPLIDSGMSVYAGVDYEAILAEAEEDGDVVVWDGGNNDTPFFQPDVHIVLADPHRVGHETAYHPGEINLRSADIVLLQKSGSIDSDRLRQLEENVRRVNTAVPIVLADLEVDVTSPGEIKGKRVLVVEDGPTLTHGEMAFGAGELAARQFQAASLVDPKPAAVGSIRETFQYYPHLGHCLPAMGYGTTQILELQETIQRTECDLVLAATPLNLGAMMELNKPVLRVKYRYKDFGQPSLGDVLHRQWPELFGREV